MADKYRPPKGTEAGTWHWLEADHVRGHKVYRALEWKGKGWLVGTLVLTGKGVAECGWRYVAPCLTPDEAAGLRTEMDEFRDAICVHVRRQTDDRLNAEDCRRMLVDDKMEEERLRDEATRLPASDQDMIGAAMVFADDGGIAVLRTKLGCLGLAIVRTK